MRSFVRLLMRDELGDSDVASEWLSTVVMHLSLQLPQGGDGASIQGC